MTAFAHDLRRSLIRAVPGRGRPLRVNADQGLALATVDLDSWRAAYDLATDELLCSSVGDDEALFAASDRLEVVRVELNAALRRYKRALAESQGRRWLKAVPRG